MAKDDVQQVQDVEATDAHAEVVETDWKAQARKWEKRAKRKQRSSRRARQAKRIADDRARTCSSARVRLLKTLVARPRERFFTKIRTSEEAVLWDDFFRLRGRVFRERVGSSALSGKTLVAGADDLQACW